MSSTIITGIDGLNDDCLLEIFCRLHLNDKLKIPLVCKRWKNLSEQSNDVLYHQLTAIGTVVSNCSSRKEHNVYAENTFGSMMKSSNLSPSCKGKFSINKRKLNQLLVRMPYLKCIVLRFCKYIDKQIVKILVDFTPNLQHFDISMSIIEHGHKILDEITLSMGSNLLHIDLTGSEGIEEDEVMRMLKNSNHLEELTIGRNIPAYLGFFLAYVPETINKVTIYGIEKLAGTGIRALIYLSSGYGKNLQILKLKGQLNLNLIKMIPTHFPYLKILELGDFFSDMWIDANNVEIGDSLARIHNLEELILTLPELIQFDGNIIEIAKRCLRLKSLTINGGSLNDITIQRVCNFMPNLEKLSLSYTNNFQSHCIKPTDDGLINICSLIHLSSLTLNGTRITDDALIMIIPSCKNLIYLDVRNNPLLTYISLIACNEFALMNPKRIIKLYTDIHSDLVFTANLKIIQETKIDYEDEYEEDDETIQDLPEIGSTMND